MSDENLAEVLRLYQRLEERTEELNKLKSQRRNSAMITALAGIAVALISSGENLWTRAIEQREVQQRLEKQKAAEEVDEQSVSKLAELLLSRQGDAEDLMVSYASAIISVMTPSQQRRIDKWLLDRGIEPIHMVESNPAEVFEQVPPLVEVPAPKSVYQRIQQQVKEKGDLPVEKLEEALNVKSAFKKKSAR